MKKIPPVDQYAYWENPPPEASPRLQYWKDKIASGWRPNKRVRKMGYDNSAEFFGVYMWEYLHVISPLLYEWAPQP